MKIAILYICTGKYKIFWKDFYLSCEKYFITDAEKEYFVFTDAENIDFENNKNVHRVYQENLGWPGNTLLRYDIFLKNVGLWEYCDYSFFFNSNLIFLNKIEIEEFLPDGKNVLVACLHPGFFNKKRANFTYETNKKSLAYIPKNEGRYYVAGGINGGRTGDFIQAIKEIRERIEKDRKNGITAVWHDESHWNKYVAGNENRIKIITPSYLYPEDKELPFDKKIIILDKNKYGGHFNLRGQRRNVNKKFFTLIERIIKKFFN